jgi:prophage antirepressor-like protein
MEIFNEILKINNNEIVIIYDINGNIWFALRDIIKALGYISIRNAITEIKINNIYKKQYSEIVMTPDISGVIPKQQFIKPNKIFINEDGLYELLVISRKPLAKVFMRKYITDIMPSIRKTGKYIMDKYNKNKLEKMNNELKNVEIKNKKLINNQRNIIYPIGNALYIIKKKEDNKVFYKIGYTKNLNKRLKVYNTSYPNKIFYDYYLLVKDKNIDICIKKIMHNKEFIKNKEYYVSTLKQIIAFIKKCDSSINEICCGYCLKCYQFNNIKIHKCKYKTL